MVSCGRYDVDTKNFRFAHQEAISINSYSSLKVNHLGISQPFLEHIGKLALHDFPILEMNIGTIR